MPATAINRAESQKISASCDYREYSEQPANSARTAAEMAPKLISRAPGVVSKAPHALAQIGQGNKQSCCAFLQQPVFKPLTKPRSEIAQLIAPASICCRCQQLFAGLLTALAQLTRNKW
jgi:hypothetical protein